MIFSKFVYLWKPKLKMFGFFKKETRLKILEQKLKEEHLARKAAELRLEEFVSNFKNSKEYLLYKIKKDQEELDSTVNQLNLTDITLKNLLNSVSEVIIRLDTNGIITYVNDVAQSKFNWNIDSLIGKHFATCFDPENKFNLTEHFKLFLTDQSKDYIQYSIQEQYSIRWIGQSFSLVRDKTGNSIEINSILRDISIIKEYEHNLITNKTRLENLITNLNFGILVEDENRKIVLVNKTFCKMFNIDLDPSIMTGFDCSESAEQSKHLFKDPEKFVTDINSVLFNRIKVIDFQLELVDNSVYSRDYIPIFIDNVYKGHLWLYKDITDQFNTYLAIQNSEEKYRGIMENMELGLMEVNNEDIITKVYDRFCKMLGYVPEEMIGKNAIELLLPTDHLAKVHEIASLRKQGESSAYEIEIFNKKRERVWVLVSGAPIRNIYGEVVGSVGIHYDISEHKRILKLLEEAKNEAEKARMAEVNFLANMSHEIRNPINAIIGMTNLMYDTDINKQQYEYLETIKYSSEILMSLISDVLDINKIDAGGVETHISEVNIVDITRAIVKTLSFNAQKKNVVILEEIDAKFTHHVKTDLNYFNQILLNLIGNAIKFTSKGYVKIVLRIEKESTHFYTIILEVIDTGIGIEKEDLPSIFDNFKQANPEIRQKFGGSGLGLAITKKLVEALGGTIQVESTIDKGTTFRIQWQFEKGGRINFNKLSKIESSDRINVQKLLIVEDNIINQNYLKGIFRKNNIEFMIANNGKEAVEICARNVFDIILMDIRMPEMNGYETTLWLRNQDENPNQNVPIIALTASALVDEKAKAIEVGMNDHLSKPYTEKQLISIINKYSLLSNQNSIENNASFSYKLPEYFDPNLLDEYFSGNLEHLSLVFNDFNVSLKHDLEKLNRYYVDNNLSEIRSIVHKIKPNFTMVGFSKLTITCDEIETSIIRNNTVGKSELEFHNFIEEMETVSRLIELELESIKEITN